MTLAGGAFVIALASVACGSSNPQPTPIIIYTSAPPATPAASQPATPVVTSAQFEEYFHSNKLPLVQRLQQLEALRLRIGRSGFQENQRIEIADTIDRVAAAVETHNHLFDSIDKRAVSPAEKAVTLINLLSTNTLTTPRLTTKARNMIVSYTSKPGFLAGYVAQSVKDGASPDRDAAVSDLMEILAMAGITPETGLKTIAA